MRLLPLLRSSLVALAAVAITATSSSTQERPQPETQPGEQAQVEEARAQMEAMMPMMAEMMRQAMRNTMSALADPEVARDLARFTRNYYEALVAQGFSEEQALRIVASVGFPSMPSM